MDTQTQEPSKPYDWLQTVSRALVDHDEVPMLGAAPPFSWEQFSQRIAQTFELQDFGIETGEWGWRDCDDLSSGLGTPLRAVHFTLSPLDGLGTLLIADAHIETLMAWLLKHEAGVLQLPDGDYKEAFFRYCILESIAAYQAVSEDSTLTPAMIASDDLPTTDALCLDITVRYGAETVAARLALSPELRKAWQHHFVAGAPPAHARQVSETASTQVTVECGSVTMKADEWKTLNVGDLLIPDRCSLTPPPRGTNGESARTVQGRVTLALEGTTIFVADIEEDNIKIVGYPAAVQQPNQSGVEPMTDDFSAQPEEEEEEEENGEFEEFDEFDEDAFADEEDEGTAEGAESEDEGLFAEEEAAPPEGGAPEAEATPEAHAGDVGAATEAPAAEAGAAEPQGEVPAEEASAEAAELAAAGAVPAAAAAMPEPETASEAPSAAEPAPRAAPVAPEEIPLTIKLEVARLQMNAKTLMELQPGNLLELDARPESGIDLVVNGKKVAQGELVQVGSVLGVRILEIGK